MFLASLADRDLEQNCYLLYAGLVDSLNPRAICTLLSYLHYDDAERGLAVVAGCCKNIYE